MLLNAKSSLLQKLKLATALRSAKEIVPHLGHQIQTCVADSVTVVQHFIALN